MGILNVTPDSFSGDGVYSHLSIDSALKQVESFVKTGCHILDIGGESTRPGATPVSLQEELDRVIPVIQAIHQNFDIPISIDTTKAIVADEAIKCGASIINDVSGLLHDPEMVHIAAKHQCYTIIMHSSHAAGVVEKTILGGRYIKKDIDDSEDIIVCIYRDLDKQVLFALENGIDPSKIILDPGIGFGKTVEQNIEIMARFDEIPKFYPILLGASRKSFIGYTVNAPVDKRLGGSLAALTIGIMKGAHIIRAHDVEESAQAAKLIDANLHCKK